MDTVDDCKEYKKEMYVSGQRPYAVYRDFMNFVRITSWGVLSRELLNLSCDEIFTFQGLGQMLLTVEED